MTIEEEKKEIRAWCSMGHCPVHGCVSRGRTSSLRHLSCNVRLLNNIVSDDISWRQQGREIERHLGLDEIRKRKEALCSTAIHRRGWDKESE